MLNKIKDIIILGLGGYNPLIRRVSLQGQFLWDLMQKYNVKNVVIVMDKNISKRNRITSDMIFLHRKKHVNVHVIDITQQEIDGDVLRHAFVISFVREFDGEKIALGCRILREIFTHRHMDCTL